MSILDRLYKSNPKDIASGGSSLIRRFSRFATQAGASVGPVINDAEVLSPDLVREIQFVTFEWTPGAAQLSLAALFQIIDTGSIPGFGSVGGTAPVGYPAASVSWLTIPCRLYMFPGEKILCSSLFNAGGAVNSISVYWGGWEFPRGSFAR